MNIKREFRIWGPFLLLLSALIGLASYQRPSTRQARLDAKLVAAVHSHDTDAAIEALNAGANPNVQDHYRPRPTLLIRLRHPDAAKEDEELHVHEWVPVLTSAAIFGWNGLSGNQNDKIVQALLMHGAHVNGRDYAGDSVLGQAAYQGRFDWVQQLLDCGADDESKSEALVSAVSANQPGVIRLLIVHHADINAQDRFGSTPLTWSCETHKTTLTKLLLGDGADPSRKNSRGQTALQVALGWRHPDPALIKLLKQYQKTHNQKTYKRP